MSRIPLPRPPPLCLPSRRAPWRASCSASASSRPPSSWRAWCRSRATGCGRETSMPSFDSAAILGRLAALRAADAPTHGGRVLSYVYDSGMPQLDDLAAAAMRLVQPVNGLDPTTFTSVAVMEREL